MINFFCLCFSYKRSAALGQFVIHRGLIISVMQVSNLVVIRVSGCEEEEDKSVHKRYFSKNPPNFKEKYVTWKRDFGSALWNLLFSSRALDKDCIKSLFLCFPLCCRRCSLVFSILPQFHFSPDFSWLGRYSFCSVYQLQHIIIFAIPPQVLLVYPRFSSITVVDLFFPWVLIGLLYSRSCSFWLCYFLVSSIISKTLCDYLWLSTREIFTESKAMKTVSFLLTKLFHFQQPELIRNFVLL